MGFTRNITTPSLHKLLYQAEQAYKQKDYKKACEFIDKALANQTAPEFSGKNNINGPLALQLKAAKARYKFLAKPVGALDPEIKKMSTEALKEYHKAAKGRKWDAYESFYHRLVQYYFAEKDFDNAKENLKNIFDYSLESGIRAYLFWGLRLNIPTSKIEEKINAYVKKTGTYPGHIILMRIRYKDRDGGNVFEDTIDFLKEHPTTSPANLKTALALLRESLNTDDVNQVKKYYSAVNRLAFEQPNTADRLVLVSYIMDERKKVEMIFPKVKE